MWCVSYMTCLDEYMSLQTVFWFLIPPRFVVPRLSVGSSECGLNVVNKLCQVFIVYMYVCSEMLSCPVMDCHHCGGYSKCCHSNTHHLVPDPVPSALHRQVKTLSVCLTCI